MCCWSYVSDRAAAAWFSVRTSDAVVRSWRSSPVAPAGIVVVVVVPPWCAGLCAGFAAEGGLDARAAAELAASAVV
jgi:hypothetical protein